MTDTMIKAIELTKTEISKIDELHRESCDHTLSEEKKNKLRIKIQKLDIKLAKRAKRFGEDFFDEYMSDLCCSYEEQLELLD